MFKTARIKLTAWYLLIIMTLTLSFSCIVYSSVADFTTKALESQRRRLERQFLDSDVVVFVQRPIPFINAEVAEEIKARTFVMLAIINITILGLTGGLGYFLAGKTLEPIEKMVAKQKRFISDAAHEIKTPLTVMKANLEVSIRDPNLDIKDAKDIMQITIGEVDTLHNLTQQLLLQSKYLINGSQETNVENFDAAAKVKELVSKYESVATKNSASLIVNANKPAFIKANVTTFEILIRNLMDNAFKYGRSGNTVTLTTIKKEKQVIIEVQDTGMGIPVEDLPYIFDAFYKADKSRTKVEKEGAGLGLSICKEIVKSLKGDIQVKSILGEGTTFTVQLPLSDYSQEPQIQ